MLFSGGVDSTIATLSLAKSGNVLTALSIDYFGRPKSEVFAARQLAARLPFDDYCEVTIGTGELLTIPEHKSTKREGWIPYRNIMFWAIAAHKAVKLGVDFIAAGHDEVDEVDYSDASKEYFSLLHNILRFDGSHNNMRELQMKLPAQNLSLESISQLLSDGSSEILDLTWSCWRDSPRPCGECLACRDRHQFLIDVAKY